MPLIPEIFRLDGRDDIPETQEDPVTEDEHLDELDGQDPWLEALERQAASNQIQGTTPEWRCVRCDPSIALQTGQGRWTCTTCYSTDFHATDQAFADRQSEGHGCFSRGLLMDYLNNPIHPILLNQQAGEMDSLQHPSRDGKGSNTTELYVAEPDLQKTPAMADCYELPESETPTYDPTVDLNSAAAAARYGDLRLDPARALQLHRLLPRSRSRQQQGRYWKLCASPWNKNKCSRKGNERQPGGGYGFQQPI